MELDNKGTPNTLPDGTTGDTGTMNLTREGTYFLVTPTFLLVSTRSVLGSTVSVERDKDKKGGFEIYYLVSGVGKQG